MSSACSFYAAKVAFDIVSKFSSPIRKRSRIDYNHSRAHFYDVYGIILISLESLYKCARIERHVFIDGFRL